MATQTHEFKAKTVDDAIDEGLRTLARARGEVDIEIVQKGSRGIFGIGSEPAIVRLTPRAVVSPVVSPVAPAAPVAPLVPPVVNEPVIEPMITEVDDATETLLAIDAVPLVTTAADIVAEMPPVAEAVVTPEREQAQAATAATDDTIPVADVTNEAESDQELIAMASALLHQMVHLMGFEAEIQASWQEDDAGEEQDEEQGEDAQANTGRYLLLDIEGTELGALIGRRGETLENIQYLLRLMVNQKIHQWKNIVVDVEHYKARRVTQLTQLAARMAEQVERTGRAMSLEPMPANERRIVHMALREHPGVFTESHGDGGRRKVHIVAKT